MKVICIERIDKMVIGTIREKMKGKEYRILITPDHPTPISLRTHTNDPVPFLLCGTRIKKGNFNCYDEFEAEKSGLFVDQGYKLLELLFGEYTVNADGR